MTDFITMQNLIARRVRNTASAATSGIQTDIQQAIIEAISFCKHDMYWFNQQDAVLNTVADQEYYPLPADYISMINIKLQYSPSWYETLWARTEQEVDELNNSAVSGYPSYYCIHNQQLRLSCIPDDAYQMNMSYVRDILVDSPLDSDTATNEWMTDGAPMIRYRAQSIIWDDLIQSPEQAMRSYNRFLEYKSMLERRTNDYLSSRRLKPQYF